jgi:hypothetical protein
VTSGVRIGGSIEEDTELGTGTEKGGICTKL